MLIHDLILRAEGLHSRRPAIIDGDTRHTYAESGDRVRRAAAALTASGLAPGQHVAILARNTHRFFEAYFACSFAGLVAVPINHRLAPAEVSVILDDCDSRAILLDPDCAAAMPPQATLQRILLGGPEGAAPHWEALIRDTPPAVEASSSGTEDGLAHLCYTGGTTGRPKGVMLSHRNVVSSAMNKIVLGSFDRTDVWLHAAPMFHQADAWACFAFTALGARHVFLPQFDADLALELIETHGVTGTQIVPTMILLMLDAPAVEVLGLRSLRRILYGSAPMPSEHLARGEAAFGPVFQHIYGLTEAAGTVAATPWPPAGAETTAERRTSCGQPIIGVDVRVVDESGRVLPSGTVGRLQARGANVMLGYWRREVETRAALADGWLDTGDLGYRDDGGYIFIVDRARDMIISGGENVYSTEVEEALCAHPGIAEAAVIGIPDRKWGEAVTAIVVPRAGIALTPEAVIAHCRTRLAGYKCPKSVRFVTDLPRTPTGKIAKAELRRALSEPPRRP